MEALEGMRKEGWPGRLKVIVPALLSAEHQHQRHVTPWEPPASSVGAKASGDLDRMNREGDQVSSNRRKQGHRQGGMNEGEAVLYAVCEE